MPIQEGEIEYAECVDIEMGEMEDMEYFEGFGSEDGKHFPLFLLILIGHVIECSDM